MITAHVKPRDPGQRDVLSLACDPIETVRIGFIGLGVRASRALERFMHIDGVRIVALCDLDAANLSGANEILARSGRSPAATYAEQESWRKLCERQDIDLVYVCTDWLTHTSMAVYAMQWGKHVALEVPAAVTVEGCWRLVDTAEKTRRHCIMLENCCYDSFELNTLNMVRQGVFGELVHAEGGYLHDLRERILTGEHGMRKGDNWQAKYNTRHTGNPYPTHGLGPLCQKLGIHRGDRLQYLVSMSSLEAGMSRYAREKFGEGSPEACREYMLGDMSSSLVMTQRGRTILLQHNIATPRPYSRLQLIYGTKGFACKYPYVQIALEPEGERLLTPREVARTMERYRHPILSEIGAWAQKLAGDRARDLVMDRRLIECLRRGLPLDMDVYDAAEWSCFVELTERSVLAGSQPVEIPDFTRGAWNKLESLEFA